MLDYTAIDFETANSYRGSPCAVGLVRVRDGVVVDENRWLIRPPAAVDYFDGFNVMIHGITADLVKDAPRWNRVLPEILGYIGDDIVVAHNAGFDIGVMRSACDVDGIPWPTVRFVCTLVMSRRALVLPSYRLPFVADALGVQLDNHHDPLADAKAVVGIVDALAARHGAGDIEALASSLRVSVGRMTRDLYTGSLAKTDNGSSPLVRPEANPDADPAGHLYGRVVVFTGALMSMTRQDAWDECARVGAIPAPNITRRTNVLVIGNINPSVLRPGASLTAKAAKAFALRAEGQDIEVMTEDDFLRCIDGKALTQSR